jgi:hypothetical protein
MPNRKRFKKLPLILIILFSVGSFSFALDKKDPTPILVYPQQECSDEEGTTSAPGASIPSTATQGNKADIPESLTPPLFRNQDGLHTKI